jgi:beta-glucuronidase
MLYPQANSCREVFEVNGFYRFKVDPGDVGEKRKWYERLDECRELAVPGSWNEQCAELSDFNGIGWYEKQVSVPSSWADRRVWLRVGSVNQDARVWLNGRPLGEHVGGYLPFEFDVTETVVFGKPNRLTIRVDNTLRRFTLPPGHKGHESPPGFWCSRPDVPFDFYPMGGVQRPVYLYATSRTRVEQVAITTDIKGDSARVACRIRVSGTDAEKVRLSVDGVVREAPLDSEDVAAELELANPILWEPGRPHLYELRVELWRGDKRIDEYVQTFGVRSVRMTKTQLLLNGRPVFLKGFGKHEDFHVIGKGLSCPLIVRDFDMLHWIGANSFRTSHYPYAEEVYDYADRHGILVIDEAPFVGLGDAILTEPMLERAKTVIGEMIARDRNHPCVVAWSLANEPMVSRDLEKAEWFFKEMAEYARSLDPTRPIMYVAHETPATQTMAKYFDAVGVNKYYSWYEHVGDLSLATQPLVEMLTAFHEQFGIPVLLSEFGADAVAGLHSYPERMFTEGYQMKVVKRQYEAIKDLPFVIGAHVWNFADFATGQSISRVGGNRKGVFTRAREPKMAAYALRELWRKSDG